MTKIEQTEKQVVTAQLLRELVTGTPIERIKPTETPEQLATIRKELDERMESSIRKNAEARRLAKAAARNKVLD